jgi:hypothetical protein
VVLPPEADFCGDAFDCGFLLALSQIRIFAETSEYCVEDRVAVIDSAVYKQRVLFLAFLVEGC